MRLTDSLQSAQGLFAEQIECGYADVGMWRHDWRDPEEKFTFAVCAVALAVVIAKVWFK